MRYLNIVLFVFLGMASFCSNAAPQKFKYFKMDILDGWEAKEEADGYRIIVESEDTYTDSKGKEQAWNTLLVAVFFPDAGESAEQSAKKFIAMHSKDRGFNVKRSRIIADNKNNLVTFFYFVKPDADVSAMIRSATLHTIPVRPSAPVQSKNTVKSKKGVKDIYKLYEKTIVECNDGRLLYVQPADSSRYGVGKCWGNATYSPTNCGELMDKTIEWCSF